MNILVSGASSGIGYAVAEALASRGHRVIAVARTFSLLDSLNQKYKDRVDVIVADISTLSGCDKVVEFVGEKIKALDCLVHAAGSQVDPAHYQDLDATKILADMNIHVMTPISLNNRLKQLLNQGRILYIDSYSSNSPRSGWAGYSIVKAAAQMAARSAADEIEDSRVIRVFPGAVCTPLVERVINSEQRSATVDMFNKMNSAGQITEPKIIGEFIANILLNATNSQLDEREYWDFHKPGDHIFSGNNI